MLRRAGLRLPLEQWPDTARNPRGEFDSLRDPIGFHRDSYIPMVPLKALKGLIRPFGAL